MKVFLILLLTYFATAEQFDPEVQAFGIFNRIIEKYVEPYVESLTASFNRILNALNNKVDNIKEILDEESMELEKILRGPVVKIVNLANDIGADVHYIASQMKYFVKQLISNMVGIAKTQKEILIEIFDHVIDKIVDRALEEKAMSAVDVGEPKVYIISRIVEKIINPIVNQLKRVLERIGEEIQTRAPNLKEKIDDQVNQITEILKPVVVRAIDLLNDVGANVSALVESLRTTVRNIIVSFTGFSSETKDALLKIANHIIDNLFGKQDQLGEISTFNPLTDEDIESYFILDKLYEKLVDPLLNRIVSIIQRMADAMDRRAPNLKEFINDQLNEISSILKPHVVRISNLLNDLGANVEGLVSMVITRVSSVIDNLVGVSQETKNGLIEIMKHFFRTLFDLIPRIEA